MLLILLKISSSRKCETVQFKESRRYNSSNMKDASSTLQRRKRSRIDLIRKAASGKCEMNCEGGGRLMNCGKEVLTKNKIHPIVFTTAVRELLLLFIENILGV